MLKAALSFDLSLSNNNDDEGEVIHDDKVIDDAGGIYDNMVKMILVNVFDIDDNGDVAAAAVVDDDLICLFTSHQRSFSYIGMGQVLS